MPASRGFEAMATSEDEWTIYPILEGARTDDPDQRRRIVYEFDVRSSGRGHSDGLVDAVIAGRASAAIERVRGDAS